MITAFPSRQIQSLSLIFDPDPNPSRALAQNSAGVVSSPVFANVSVTWPTFGTAAQQNSAISAALSNSATFADAGSPGAQSSRKFSGILRENSPLLSSLTLTQQACVVRLCLRRLLGGRGDIFKS